MSDRRFQVLVLKCLSYILANIWGWKSESLRDEIAEYIGGVEAQ